MTDADSGDALWREILNSISIEYGLLRDFTTLYAGIGLAIVLAILGNLLLHLLSYQAVGI